MENKFRLKASDFVGNMVNMNYSQAIVTADDSTAIACGGLPQTAFLIATDADINQTLRNSDQWLLLRIQKKQETQYTQENADIAIDMFRKEALGETINLDPFSKLEMQRGFLETRIMGQIYINQNGQLELGADVENIINNTTNLKVYKPRGKSLEKIVNFSNGERVRMVRKNLDKLGITSQWPKVRYAKVRYGSTEKLSTKDDHASVFLRPEDLLGNKTAVFAMTRSGKTTLAKNFVESIKMLADVSESSTITVSQMVIGEVSEYAETTIHGTGIADKFPSDTYRYSMLDKPGYRSLKTNFFEQIEDGFNIIQAILEGSKGPMSQPVRTMLEIGMEEPDRVDDPGEWNRYQPRKAAYLVALSHAGFKEPKNFKIAAFPVNKDVIDAVNAQAGKIIPNPSSGLTINEMEDWLWYLRKDHAEREADDKKAPLVSSGSKKVYVDDRLSACLDVMVGKKSGTPIRGFRVFTDALGFHSPSRTVDLLSEIYQILSEINGSIVIVDLSEGDPEVSKKLGDRIMRHVFNSSRAKVNEGMQPPFITVFIEEAHNLIPKTQDLTGVWPRTAKEGSKYGIGMVYITQEVSSVHPNILANTENIFAFGMNNVQEANVLAHYFDFADFKDSILTSHDVGFARGKTLSHPFVVPMQIYPFISNTDGGIEEMEVA
tara:strand:- start:420 stop:2402 length:1983 start_codon:yes stop_codon:yes gene_type:complete